MGPAEWVCPKCGYTTNSDRMKSVHQGPGRHECEQAQKGKAKPMIQIVDSVSETLETLTRDDYENMTKNELVKLLVPMKVDFDKRWNKDRLIDLLMGGE